MTKHQDNQAPESQEDDSAAIAAMTFKPMGITPENSAEDWIEWGRNAGVAARICAELLNKSDEEMEADLRAKLSGASPSNWREIFDQQMALMEWLVEFKKAHESGADVLTSAVGRLMVILERVLPDCPADDGDAK